MDEFFREPSRETRVRVQGDKDTARGDGSTDRNTPPWKIGDQLNEFELVEFLGKGSSGFVYRAFDTIAQRHCALKLLLPGTPEDLVRNKLGFRRMMSLSHPNLLRVDRIHQLGDYIAMSMEEVSGKTLPKALKEMKSWEDPMRAYQQLLKLTSQFAAGLSVMHLNGYVHRDVKPQNLMVDDQGNGRVIDYGLVGTYDTETDPQGYRHYLAGTPRYFAPEMLWNQFYLPAGDIFGLGMVMLESLQAISLDHGGRETTVERSEANPHDDAEQIDEALAGLADAVPDELREICLEMLQRDLGDRPTAMRVARVGNTEAAPVAWPQENALIGRQREVTEICSWLTDIYSGQVGRLHLSGPSGIGKSRLLDDIETYVRSMRWGQIFRAGCRQRENQPLQAFDQICDAIANRYKRGDREPLDLDPVSATILHTVFPALRKTIRCSMQLTPAGNTTERLDALEAAARMSVELRKVGPLILIIDDAQWADRDSLNVLDRLQGAGGEIGMGIITVSRDRRDQQRVPANRTLRLKPLNMCDSNKMLSEAARSWGINASPAVIEALSQAAAGSPFRLQELVDEFRPGGALSQIGDETGAGDSVSQLGKIDWLWQKRANRLSEETSRVLAYVVTAGCRVSTQQLGHLSGLEDAVDASISELVRQRLITDHATGGECIKVVHDRVADGLIQTLDEEVKRKAHHAWASLLIHEDNSEKQAARIASHLIAAGEPGRAVSHAALAAEEAARLLAFTEAARWHAMIVDHVEGAEKVNRIRQAARCFCEADHPIEAAKFYRQLADHVDANERVECQLLAATMAIRGGCFAEVRDQLSELAKTLGLPRPKSIPLSKMTLAARAMRATVTGATRISLTPEAADAGKSASSRDRQRLHFCMALARPLSMFDNLYAAELNMTGEALAATCGSQSDRVVAVVGRSVFGCYDRGSKRTKSESTLLDIRPAVERMNDPRAAGDLWSGIAFSHALSCRWNQVPDAVRFSLEHYHDVPDANGFEAAHVRWLDIWAHWHLGRWGRMFHASGEMFDDAVRRHDLFQRLVVTNGLGSCFWLGRDRLDELQRLREDQTVRLRGGSMQVFHLFDWITSVQTALYQENEVEAWRIWKSRERELRRLPYNGIQMFRIMRSSLGSLTALHNGAASDPKAWRTRVTRLTSQLRKEQLPFATVVANLHDGLLNESLSSLASDVSARTARIHLMAASQQAKSLSLRPFELAANDALARLDTGRDLGLLQEKMSRSGIERPELFERLYTLPGQSSGPGESAQGSKDHPSA